MVFVHARNATMRTANVIKELALKNQTHKLFLSEESTRLAQRAFQRSPNKYLNELIEHGLSVHHAGMLRTDRYSQIMLQFSIINHVIVNENNSHFQKFS